MAEDQRKVWLVAEFLEDSFVGCSVFYDYEDKERVPRSYRIVDHNTGKLLHQVFVTRGFLDDHAEAEIVPALQDLAFLACLRNAGSRRVIVKTRMIEIEPRRVIVEPDYRGVIPATEGGFNAELRLIIFRTFLNSARACLARVRIALARAITSNRRKR